MMRSRRSCRRRLASAWRRSSRRMTLPRSVISPRRGTGPNTLRAIASDLNYLETWSYAALGHALPWPATEALALKFVAHHLYDEDEHERDASHGMPKDVRALLLQDGCLKTDGPHAPATVRRRLALWSTMHRWKGLQGPVRVAKRPPRPASRSARQPAAPFSKKRSGRNQGGAREAASPPAAAPASSMRATRQSCSLPSPLAGAGDLKLRDSSFRIWSTGVP